MTETEAAIERLTKRMADISRHASGAMVDVADIRLVLAELARLTRDNEALREAARRVRRILHDGNLHETTRVVDAQDALAALLPPEPAGEVKPDDLLDQEYARNVMKIVPAVEPKP